MILRGSAKTKDPCVRVGGGGGVGEANNYSFFTYSFICSPPYHSPHFWLCPATSFACWNPRLKNGKETSVNILCKNVFEKAEARKIKFLKATTGFPDSLSLFLYSEDLQELFSTLSRNLVDEKKWSWYKIDSRNENEIDNNVGA